MMTSPSMFIDTWSDSQCQRNRSPRTLILLQTFFPLAVSYFWLQLASGPPPILHCSFFPHPWPRVGDSKSTRIHPPAPEWVSNPSPVGKTSIVRVDLIDPIAQLLLSLFQL